MGCLRSSIIGRVTMYEHPTAQN